MILRLSSAHTSLAQYFNKWRLILVLFLVVYFTILALNIDYALVQWDETQHFVSGLLLRRGEFQEYIQFSYYPPLFDVITAVTYAIIGSSLFSVRLVSLGFGILSVWAVFEYAYRLYGPKNALISSVLLASMPGFILVSRLALLETALLFFFSISLLLFFSWIQTNNQKHLMLSGIVLGLGFLTKYQVGIAGAVMLVSVLFLRKKPVKYNMRKILFVALIAAVVILPWLFVAYNNYTSERVEQWVYTLKEGSVERLEYGERFPLPLFYMVEMTYPYMDLHPISLPIFVLGVLGLGYWIWRRKPEDKFSLIWFVVVYVVYTFFVSNRNWRYIIPLFPILAVAASDFVLVTFNKIQKAIQGAKIKVSKPFLNKLVAVVFAMLLLSAVGYSVQNANYWIEKDNIHLPVKEAAQYAVENSDPNQISIVLYAVNFFSPDSVYFYMKTCGSSQRGMEYYPDYAVDSYEPVFNQTQLIEQCKNTSTKYVFLYENANTTYFHSEWTAHDILEKTVALENFELEKTFGTSPHRLFLIRFST
jgi:4-amino-4-deoxy-L-arabinose transferase-like glycosyltransferase